MPLQSFNWNFKHFFTNETWNLMHILYKFGLAYIFSAYYQKLMNNIWDNNINTALQCTFYINFLLFRCDNN